MEYAAPKLYRRWVFACTVGELVGFGALPVLGGVLALWLTAGLEPTARPLALYAAAIVGGLGEGALLALFQLHVLKELIPNLSGRRWVTATAAAAAFAWACGMLAPMLNDVAGISVKLQIAIWLPAGLLILLSIGTAQSWALRRTVENPNSWILANVLAWLAGLPWTFALPALVPENAPMSWWIATFALAGTLMGLTVGLVTGLYLLRLRPTEPLRQSPRQQP